MDTDPTVTRPVAEPRPVNVIAKVSALPWLLAIAFLALAAWAGWRAFGPKDLGDPLATSLVAFEKQDRLTVFSAQLSPVVSADDSQFFGVLKSRQVAVIPARVDYTINLGAVTRDRMKWDAATQSLSVLLPPLEVSRPNLDEARAQYLREGVWISRTTQDKLTRNNTQLAEQQARSAASSPVLLDLAKAAAREAVERNLTIPLKVAGYREVKVTVRFDGEAVS